MPSGGARVRSGPPPDPDALRRDRETDQSTWRALPDTPVEAPPPEWPLTKARGGAAKREAQIWAEQWRRPQAVVWREMGVEVQVALYVRTLRRAEAPDASAELTRLSRQFMDDLGISMDGMLRKRWRIGALPTAAAPTANVRNDGPDRPSARSRFQTIEGGAGRTA